MPRAWSSPASVRTVCGDGLCAVTLAIRTLTGDTTTLRDVASSHTVHAVTARLCVETGEEPTLTLLLHEQRPLADRKNALKDYNQKQIQQLNDLITTTLPYAPLAISTTLECTFLLLSMISAPLLNIHKISPMYLPHVSLV